VSGQPPGSFALRAAAEARTTVEPLETGWSAHPSVISANPLASPRSGWCAKVVAERISAHRSTTGSQPTNRTRQHPTQPALTTYPEVLLVTGASPLRTSWVREFGPLSRGWVAFRCVVGGDKRPHLLDRNLEINPRCKGSDWEPQSRTAGGDGARCPCPTIDGERLLGDPACGALGLGHSRHTRSPLRHNLGPCHAKTT
jgi:hypothetical protein